MKRPCIWCCLSAIGGILLGVASSVDAMSLGVILTLMAVGWWSKPRFLQQVMVFGMCFILFFMRVSDEIDQRTALATLEMTGSGVVVSRSAAGMDVKVNEPEAWRGKHVKIWVNQPESVGTQIQFAGSFLPLKRAGNPGERDDLLAGAAQNLWLESACVRILQAIPPESGVRVGLQRAIETDFPKDMQGMASALILADRSALNTDQRDAIREMGLSHLMAISGFHFVLILYGLRFLFRRMGASPWFSNAAGLVLLWGYGGMIGFPIAALRALVLMSFIAGGAMTRQRVDRVNLLFAAAFVLLWVEPFSLFSLGFQLSVAATLSLLVLPRWMKGIFFSRTPMGGKFLSPILAVQVGVLPLAVRGFGEWSWMAVFGNLLLAPVFLLVMAVLLIWAVLAMMGISHGFAPLPVFLLQGWVQTVRLFADHFLTLVSLPKPSWLAVLSYYLCLGFFFEASMGQIRLSLAWGKRLGMALAFALILGLMVPGPVRFWVLDVGQGDALLLERAGHGILWDAGGSPWSDWEVGRQRVEPALDALGISEVDLGICTHFDADHVEGMVELVKDNRIGRIVMGPCQTGNCWQASLMKAAAPGQCIAVDQDFSLLWGNGIEIRVFVPTIHGKENENSLLTRLQVGETVLWLTGDMEAVNEGEWRSKLDLKGDILKVPHHGSNSSTTVAFLEEMNPEVALISVGANNPYGHPAQAVLERLDGRGIEVWRTDRDGALELRFDQRGYTLIPYRKPRLPFRRWIAGHGLELAWLGLVAGLAGMTCKWRNEEDL